VDTIAALSLVVPVAVEIQRLVQARLVQLRDLVDTCRYLEGIAGSAVGTIVVVPAAVEIQCLEWAVGVGQSLGVLATEHYQPMQNLKQTWVMLGQLVQQKEQSPRDSAFQRDLVVPRWRVPLGQGIQNQMIKDLAHSSKLLPPEEVEPAQ
jgi:hypothetical protein